MAKQRSVIASRVAARLAMLHEGVAPTGISPLRKAKIVELIQHGATLTEIETLDGMPRANTIWDECKRDPAFAQAMSEARAVAAASILDEAQHNLRDAAQNNDPDKMRIAADYARGCVAYAEKIAPREFGQLVKLAGADGGALTISVVNYAEGQQAISGGTLEGQAVLAREEIEASETPR